MIVFEPLFFKGFYQYDHELGFRVRPYANDSNRFGFNDADHPLQKPPGAFRILIIGDSFNWAGGRDKNYTAVLRRKFESEYKARRVEIINVGYPMTAAPQQFVLLKRYGLQYQPDVVVLGFFAGNDFSDADPNIKRIVVNDTYFEIDKRREWVVFGYPIVPAFRLLTFVKQKYLAWKEFMRPRAVAAQTANEQHEATMSEESFLSIEKDRLKFCDLELQRLGTFNPHINLTFESLAKIAELLKLNRTRFVVAMLPDEFQVDESLLTKVLTHYGLDRAGYDVDLQQKILRKFLESNNIPYIDLLDQFRQAGRNNPLYKLRDTHWNDVGNELAANILFSQLPKILDGLE